VKEWTGNNQKPAFCVSVAGPPPSYSPFNQQEVARRTPLLRIMTEAELICSTLVGERECGSAGAE